MTTDQQQSSIAIRPPEEDALIGAFDMGSVDPMRALRKAEEIVTFMAAKCTGERYIANISSRKYPKVDWWTTVGMGLGLFPVEISSDRLDDGEHITYLAVVEVRRSGQTITRASAICSSRESTWAGRDEYAIKSMATTRATGKAYRIGLSGLAVMAGLEPTPAEEMPAAHEEGRGEDESTRTSAKDKGFGVCPIHGVPYSQSEKQRESGFPPSHRRKEGGYCERRAEEPREAAPPAATPPDAKAGAKPAGDKRPAPIPTGTERARVAIEKLIDGEVGSKAWLDARSRWINENFPELVKKGWAYWSDEDWNLIAAKAEAEQAKRVDESWGAMAPQAPAVGGTT